MNKTIVRIVGLVLVPCLIGDPVTASAFGDAFSPRATTASTGISANRFSAEALEAALAASAFSRPFASRLTALLDRLAEALHLENALAPVSAGMASLQTIYFSKREKLGRTIWVDSARLITPRESTPPRVEDPLADVVRAQIQAYTEKKFSNLEENEKVNLYNSSGAFLTQVDRTVIGKLIRAKSVFCDKANSRWYLKPNVVFVQNSNHRAQWPLLISYLGDKPEKFEKWGRLKVAGRALLEEFLILFIVFFPSTWAYHNGSLDANQTYWIQWGLFGLTAILHGLTHGWVFKWEDGKIITKKRASWSYRLLIFPIISGLFRVWIFWYPEWGFLGAFLGHAIYDQLPGVPLMLAAKYKPATFDIGKSILAHTTVLHQVLQRMTFLNGRANLPSDVLKQEALRKYLISLHVELKGAIENWRRRKVPAEYGKLVSSLAKYTKDALKNDENLELLIRATRKVKELLERQINGTPNSSARRSANTTSVPSQQIGDTFGNLRHGEVSDRAYELFESRKNYLHGRWDYFLNELTILPLILLAAEDDVSLNRGNIGRPTGSWRRRSDLETLAYLLEQAVEKITSREQKPPFRGEWNNALRAAQDLISKGISAKSQKSLLRKLHSEANVSNLLIQNLEKGIALSREEKKVVGNALQKSSFTPGEKGTVETILILNGLSEAQKSILHARIGRDIKEKNDTSLVRASVARILIKENPQAEKKIPSARSIGIWGAIVLLLGLGAGHVFPWLPLQTAAIHAIALWLIAGVIVHEGIGHGAFWDLGKYGERNQFSWKGAFRALTLRGPTVERTFPSSFLRAPRITGWLAVLFIVLPLFIQYSKVHEYLPGITWQHLMPELFSLALLVVASAVDHWASLIPWTDAYWANQKIGQQYYERGDRPGGRTLTMPEQLDLHVIDAETKGFWETNKEKYSHTATGNNAINDLKTDIPRPIYAVVKVVWKKLLKDSKIFKAEQPNRKNPSAAVYWAGEKNGFRRSKFLVVLTLWTMKTDATNEKKIEITFRCDGPELSEVDSVELHVDGIRKTVPKLTPPRMELVTGILEGIKDQTLSYHASPPTDDKDPTVIKPKEKFSFDPVTLSAREAELRDKRSEQLEEELVRRRAALFVPPPPKPKKKKNEVEILVPATREKGPVAKAFETKAKPRSFDLTPSFIPAKITVIDFDNRNPDPEQIYPMKTVLGHVFADESSDWESAKLAADHLRKGFLTGFREGSRPWLLVRFPIHLSNDNREEFQNAIIEPLITASISEVRPGGKPWTDLADEKLWPPPVFEPTEDWVAIWLGPLSNTSIEKTKETDYLQQRLKVISLIETFLAVVDPDQLRKQLGAEDNDAFKQLVSDYSMIWTQYCATLKSLAPTPDIFTRYEEELKKYLEELKDLKKLTAKDPPVDPLKTLAKSVQAVWDHAVADAAIAKNKWWHAAQHRTIVVPIHGEIQRVAYEGYFAKMLNFENWGALGTVIKNLVFAIEHAKTEEKNMFLRPTLEDLRRQLVTIRETMSVTTGNHGHRSRGDLLKVLGTLNDFEALWLKQTVENAEETKEAVVPAKIEESIDKILFLREDLVKLFNLTVAPSKDGPQTILGVARLWAVGANPQEKLVVMPVGAPDLKEVHVEPLSKEVKDRLPAQRFLSTQNWLVTADPVTNVATFTRVRSIQIIGLWLNYYFRQLSDKLPRRPKRVPAVRRPLPAQAVSATAQLAPPVEPKAPPPSPTPAAVTPRPATVSSPLFYAGWGARMNKRWKGFRLYMRFRWSEFAQIIKAIIEEGRKPRDPVVGDFIQEGPTDALTINDEVTQEEVMVAVAPETVVSQPPAEPEPAAVPTFELVSVAIGPGKDVPAAKQIIEAIKSAEARGITIDFSEVIAHVNGNVNDLKDFCEVLVNTAYEEGYAARAYYGDRKNWHSPRDVPPEAAALKDAHYNKHFLRFSIDLIGENSVRLIIMDKTLVRRLGPNKSVRATQLLQKGRRAANAFIKKSGAAFSALLWMPAESLRPPQSASGFPHHTFYGLGCLFIAVFAAAAAFRLVFYALKRMMEKRRKLKFIRNRVRLKDELDQSLEDFWVLSREQRIEPRPLTLGGATFTAWGIMTLRFSDDHEKHLLIIGNDYPSDWIELSAAQAAELPQDWLFLQMEVAVTRRSGHESLVPMNTFHLSKVPSLKWQADASTHTVPPPETDHPNSSAASWRPEQWYIRSRASWEISRATLTAMVGSIVIIMANLYLWNDGSLAWTKVPTLKELLPEVAAFLSGAIAYGLFYLPHLVRNKAAQYFALWAAVVAAVWPFAIMNYIRWYGYSWSHRWDWTTTQLWLTAAPVLTLMVITYHIVYDRYHSPRIPKARELERLQFKRLLAMDPGSSVETIRREVKLWLGEPDLLRNRHWTWMLGNMAKNALRQESLSDFQRKLYQEIQNQTQALLRPRLQTPLDKYVPGTTPQRSFFGLATTFVNYPESLKELMEALDQAPNDAAKEEIFLESMTRIYHFYHGLGDDENFERAEYLVGHGRITPDMFYRIRMRAWRSMTDAKGDPHFPSALRPGNQDTNVIYQPGTDTPLQLKFELPWLANPYAVTTPRLKIGAQSLILSDVLSPPIRRWNRTAVYRDAAKFLEEILRDVHAEMEELPQNKWQKVFQRRIRRWDGKYGDVWLDGFGEVIAGYKTTDKDTRFILDGLSEAITKKLEKPRKKGEGPKNPLLHFLTEKVSRSQKPAQPDTIAAARAGSPWKEQWLSRKFTWLPPILAIGVGTVVGLAGLYAVSALHPQWNIPFWAVPLGAMAASFLADGAFYLGMHKRGARSASAWAFAGLTGIAAGLSALALAWAIGLAATPIVLWTHPILWKAIEAVVIAVPALNWLWDRHVSPRYPNKRELKSFWQAVADALIDKDVPAVVQEWVEKNVPLHSLDWLRALLIMAQDAVDQGLVTGRILIACETLLNPDVNNILTPFITSDTKEFTVGHLPIEVHHGDKGLEIDTGYLFGSRGFAKFPAMVYAVHKLEIIDPRFMLYEESTNGWPRKPRTSLAYLTGFEYLRAIAKAYLVNGSYIGPTAMVEKLKKRRGDVWLDAMGQLLQNKKLRAESLIAVYPTEKIISSEIIVKREELNQILDEVEKTIRAEQEMIARKFKGEENPLLKAVPLSLINGKRAAVVSILDWRNEQAPPRPQVKPAPVMTIDAEGEAALRQALTPPNRKIDAIDSLSDLLWSMMGKPETKNRFELLKRHAKALGHYIGQGSTAQLTQYLSRWIALKGDANLGRVTRMLIKYFQDHGGDNGLLFVRVDQELKRVMIDLMLNGISKTEGLDHKTLSNVVEDFSYTRAVRTPSGVFEAFQREAGSRVVRKLEGLAPVLVGIRIRFWVPFNSAANPPRDQSNRLAEAA